MTYDVTLDRRRQTAHPDPSHPRRPDPGRDHLARRRPRPPGAIQLKGDSAWRIRVGDHRIIYDIDDGRLTVLVLALGQD